MIKILNIDSIINIWPLKDTNPIIKIEELIYNETQPAYVFCIKDGFEWCGCEYQLRAGRDFVDIWLLREPDYSGLYDLFVMGWKNRTIRKLEASELGVMGIVKMNLVNCISEILKEKYKN